MHTSDVRSAIISFSVTEIFQSGDLALDCMHLGSGVFRNVKGAPDVHFHVCSNIICQRLLPLTSRSHVWK